MIENDKVRYKELIYRLYNTDSRGKLIARWGKKLLFKIWGRNPVPLPILFLLSKIVSKSKQVNGLRTRDDFEISYGSNIGNPFLSRALKDVPLGEWSLDVETINHLEKDIQLLKPEAILEFGSGVSTLSLVHFLLEIHGKSPVVRVYSIEQDENFVRETEKLLKDFGYDNYVQILHAPLVHTQVDGIDLYSYDLRNIGEFLAGRKPDYCLVDGPSSSSFEGRYATLPLVRNYLAKIAHFRLDDALRDRELLIAEKWRQLPYIHIDGIVMLGKGILAGSLMEG